MRTVFWRTDQGQEHPQDSQDEEPTLREACRRLGQTGSHDAERSYMGEGVLDIFSAEGQALPEALKDDCYAGKRGEAEASSGATAEGLARRKAIWSVVI